MRYIGIIPARYASTRFPGKPLAMLGDKTVIERVYTQARKSLDAVAVATDDERIYRAVEAFGGRAVMTSDKHRSGTDRVYEAYCHLAAAEHISDRPSDVVIINIQGDEPFIDPAQIDALKGCFANPQVDIATLVRPFDPALGYDALDNPNTPKVVRGVDGHALYFSRSVIPYVRGHQRSEWPALHQYYTHVGIYAYRADVLERITSLPQSPLELAESLEQLRWLQNGYTIQTALTTAPTIGIDTPDDLLNAIKYLHDHA